MSKGVLYVAYGSGAIRETTLSIKSLQVYHDWPVSVISDTRIQGVGLIRQADHMDAKSAGRWAKVQLDQLTPYEPTLFLDADTRVHGDLNIGFDILQHGYEMVMIPSVSQGENSLAHLTEIDRVTTQMEALSTLQLNTGVMWFSKTEAVTSLFAAWRDEWQRFKDKDQGALLRALACNPVKMWLLGRPYNGGVIVQHRFGACKRG